MEKEQFAGYTYVEGGVCAAQGFVAGGIHCGINPDKAKKDLALVYSSTVCHTAAVYTRNKVKGAPIYVTRDHLKKSGGLARAVIVNSKNANTCNANGIEIAEETSRLLAEELHIPPEEVIVASTGVIGETLDIAPFAAGIPKLVKMVSTEGHTDAMDAIMTTDTVRKEIAVEFAIQGKVCRLGGMAKGSGMIHPDMATTLTFLTTDAAVSADMVQAALSDIVKITHNCLYIDGDTSTNDMVSVMANGAAGNIQISSFGADYEIFRQALYIVMSNLTKMLAADGEGATKFLECTCSGAPDTETAITVAKSIIGSDLFKCAMFGEDANCGRILCAIGYAEADFAVEKVNIDLASDAGKLSVCRNGFIVEFSEELAAKILAEDAIFIHVDLQSGDSTAKAWGCDLTYDYVKINGDYRS